MAVRIYIDGFNLYNGAIKRSGVRWLDLARWGEVIAGESVDRIVYCTAIVKETLEDPRKPARQVGYVNVLQSFPNIDVLFGQFRERTTAHQYADCKQSPPCFVKTIKREEKGSDVNLASRLLHDGHMRYYDRAIVVSGDSDLVEPIRLVTEELRLPVSVLNPHGRRSNELRKVASTYGGVDISAFNKCVLPDPFRIGNRLYHQPARWKVSPLIQCEDVVHGQCQACGVDYCSRKFVESLPS